MALPPRNARGLPVPSGRLARLARFGGLASGVAGGMLLDGARQFASGKRPSVGDLLLTPANAAKVTRQLSQLRGAAMKMGQLLSMDAGEMLPRELADILAGLRADAQHMPQRQLRGVLAAQWGAGWEDRFDAFDFTPIAAASIGQVHRATTIDGRDLAIKVQYPGVRRSIDSDVDNVAALVRVSGLLPRGLDIAPMLAEAKRQLHEEADYVAEAAHLAQFAALLDGSTDFRVPELHADLTTRDILAMSFVEGVPVESLDTAPQPVRDRVATLLIGLTLAELFDHRLMQTDPNFANYRYEPETGRIVLLDFGATRAFAAATSEQYRELLRVGLASDRAGIRQAAIAIGYLDPRSPVRHQQAILDLIELAMQPLRGPAPFDFGGNDLAIRLRDRGMALAGDRSVLHVPPIDTLFIHRKVGGTYLLASRLRARVAISPLLEPYR